MQAFLKPKEIAVSAILHRMSKNKTLFDRVVELRTDRGESITQVAMAKDFGISQGAIGKWKTGGGSHRDHLLKIAVRYGVCMDWLETGRPPKWAGAQNTPRGKLYSELDEMPEDEIQSILTIWEWHSRNQKQ